ncbi:MAG: hypothetical protein CL607_01285 [Anaerolineaceae bacterium]|nr:hypothetical protein [Anaerolineaceae bacterium]
MAEKPLRLLLFNLVTDADHLVLAFTTDWINELAPYCEYIDVVTMQVGRLAVADNVRVFSVGRELGYSEPRRAVEFYRILRNLRSEREYDACFAHMMPLFAVMGAPLLRGIPITTWYTHRQRSTTLRLATAASHRVISAVASSFPYDTDKLRPLGHGIDTDFFVPPAQAHDKPPRVVQVARLTPIKNQHILLNAAATLDCEVVLVGDTAEGYSTDYREELKQLAVELGMTERVTFTGRQTPEQVRNWYQNATLAINLSPPGLFDKAALEAMACGLPTLVSNDAFADLTGPQRMLLHISAPDATEELRQHLTTLLALTPLQRQQIGQQLRAGVVAHHSLQQLAKKVISVLRSGELPDDA